MKPKPIYPGSRVKVFTQFATDQKLIGMATAQEFVEYLYASRLEYEKWLVTFDSDPGREYEMVLAQRHVSHNRNAIKD